MGSISLQNVSKLFGEAKVIPSIDLDINDGEFVVFVGPSGCGKSTLLRLIAGLEDVSGGKIVIDGNDATEKAPAERGLAMVFQSYALYPHMTVEENLTYSLRMRGVAKAEARKAAEEVAATTGLSKLMKRYPRELSGGQRQRVAMSRAIIRNPQAFLFDEPLSNLDAALRVHMRKEIRALHDRLHATSVYVTHDQIEAMTMADHVVVMRDGVIEQQGTPLELYDRPVNRFVAGFIGSPAMNFIPGVVSPDGASLLLQFGEGEPQQSIRAPAPLPPGKRIIVGIRPEHIRPATATGAALTLPVSTVETTGSATFLTLGGTSTEVVIAIQGRSEVRSGEVVGLDINPTDLHLFDEETGAGLGGR